MKRFVCFLLTLVMIVGLVPGTVLTASAASSLETSDKAVEILKLFEGFSAELYQDENDGNWYIGYGNYVSDDEDEARAKYPDGITKSDATILLREHIHDTVDVEINNFAKRYNLAFTSYQHDALALFSYNCGTGWMAGGAFQSAVVNGKKGNDFLNAIALWNGGDPESDYFRGLMNRRMAEANMYLNNSYSSKAPTNYTYVVLDTNGGTLQDAFGNDLVAYVYSTASAPALTLVPENGSDVFLGWYLKDDKGNESPVNTLDKSTSKKTLTAKWQDSDDAVKVNYEINSSECASRKVYPDHSFDYASTGTLKANAKVTVTKEYVDEDGVKWIFVKGKNTEGKDIKGWVTLKDMDSEAGAGDTVLATGTVTAATLNVRDAATTEGDILGELSKGTLVKIYAYKSEYTVSGTRSWGKIMYNGSIGWINLAYVDVRNASDADNDSVIGKTGKIVNADVVNVREDAGVGYDKVAELKKGTKVTVYETKQITGGTTWGRIKWDGVKEGWIYMYYVQLDGQGSGNLGSGDSGSEEVAIYTGVVNSNTNLNVRRNPKVTSTQVGSLPKGTKINIYEKTTTNNVEWGRTDKGWVCLLYVTLTATGNTPSGGNGGGNHVLNKEVGTVNAASLILRKAATNNSENLGTLKKGDQVTIQEKATEATSTGSKLWGKVTVDGVTGWINLAYVTIEEKTDIIPDGSNPGGSGSGSADNGTGTAAVVSGCTNVNVRAKAGVQNTLVTTLPNGTAITVYEQKEVNNAPWARIDQGWVCMYYVTLTGEVSGNGGASGNGGTINGTTPGQISCTGIVNSNTDLNVRSGPGLGYAKVKALKKGTSVTIYEQVEADRMTWGKTDGGWVCMSYITINGTTDSGKGVMGTVARCFSHVNVRSAPGTGNALVGNIMVGTRVEIFEQKLYNNQYWGRVAQGWVCMQYILLDDELPPTAGEGSTTEPDDSDLPTGDAVINNNPGVTYSFSGTVKENLNVRKDATSESGKAGTLSAGTTVNIVELKTNRVENGYETWGRTTEYGTPGWVNLAYVDFSIYGYVQFDNTTIYSIASTSGEDLAVLRLNADLRVYELALEGTTVWGKVDLDTIEDDELGEEIGGLVAWIPMSKLGASAVYSIPSHHSTEMDGEFNGRTYTNIDAYTKIDAQTVAFKLYGGATVSVHELISDHGTVWGKVYAADFYGDTVEAWIDVSKVMFQISRTVSAEDGLNVRSVPQGNDDSNILGQLEDGDDAYITSLMMSADGVLWGQIQSSDPALNGGWINMTYTY